MAVEFGFVCSCGFGEETEYSSSDVGMCDAGCAGDPEAMCGKKQSLSGHANSRGAFIYFLMQALQLKYYHYNYNKS